MVKTAMGKRSFTKMDGLVYEKQMYTEKAAMNLSLMLECPCEWHTATTSKFFRAIDQVYQILST